MKFYIPTLIAITTTIITLAKGQQSIEDANSTQDKIINVLTNSKSSKNEWSNNIGFWTVVEPDSKSNCILLQGELNVTVFLEHNDYEIITLTVPKEAKANGTCSTLWDDFQTITLSWNDILDSNETTNYLTLTFATNWTSEFTENFSLSRDSYALNAFEIRVMNSENPKNDVLIFTVTISDIIEFKTPKNHSYSCKPYQILDYQKIQLHVANFQVEAFRDSSQGQKEMFSSPVDCSIDIEKNWKLKIIMIIVWSSITCFLVALVVAFLVFRRKCASINESEYQLLE